MGRRVEAKEASVTTFYAYLGTETLFENVSGSPNYYIYAGGMRIARVSAGTANYYHSDTLGSTRLVTSSTGKVLFSDNYQPFGTDNGTPTCSGACENYKFTGKPVSQTTGLYYYYQRWYDPSVGRFVSEDSLPSRLSDPQSSNKYGYVNNAPTTFTDPSGLAMIVGNGRLPCWDWFGLIPCHQGGVGGLVSTTTTSLSTSPEGAPIIIAGIGLYLGSIALYDVLSDYFATRPPPPPPIGGDDFTGRQGTGPTVTLPTITIPAPGIIEPSGFGGAVGFPNPAGQFGTMGQSTLFGTRIAVDNPILDPYRPRNTSVPSPSKIAKLACAAAFATGFVIGAGFDAQAAKAYIEPPIAGGVAFFLGCFSILYGTGRWN